MDRSVSDPRPFWESLYFAVCLLLIGFGAISILSIGAPFIILGAALALRGPLRHRPTLFISILIGTLAFLATTILVGFTYQEAADSPALWPAPLLGMAVGVATSVVYVRASKRRPNHATARGGK